MSVHVQEEIRRLDADGVPARRIARDLGVSRDSVTKYVAVQDYSPGPVVIHRPAVCAGHATPGHWHGPAPVLLAGDALADLGEHLIRQAHQMERVMPTSA